MEYKDHLCLFRLSDLYSKITTHLQAVKYRKAWGSNGMVLKNGLGGNIYHHLCKPLTLQNVIIQRIGGVDKYRKTMVVCCLFLVVLLHRVLRYVEFFCVFLISFFCKSNIVSIKMLFT